MIARAAQRDVRGYRDFIFRNEASMSPVERWTEGLQRAFDELGYMPERYAQVPEFGEASVRQARYASHRLVFGIDKEGETITVFRVYHSARRSLRRKNI